MFVALKHRFLAIIATALIGVLAVALLRGQIGVDDAGIRALVLIVVIVVIDRFVMPVVMLAIGAKPATAPAAPPRDDLLG